MTTRGASEPRGNVRFRGVFLSRPFRGWGAWPLTQSVALGCRFARLWRFLRALAPKRVTPPIEGSLENLFRKISRATFRAGGAGAGRFKEKHNHRRPAPSSHPRQSARAREDGRDGPKIKHTMSTATISAPLALPSPAKASPTTSPLEFAVQQILAKRSRKEILADLTARYYLSDESALAIVKKAYALKHAAFRKAGVKVLIIGIVMAFLGVVITGISHDMAKAGGGYVIFIGLIVVGIVNIVKGLFRILVG